MTDGSKNKIVLAIETVRREAEALAKRHDVALMLIEQQQRVLDQCPACLPDGTGLLSPLNWIQWARKRLGYDE